MIIPASQDSTGPKQGSAEPPVEVLVTGFGPFRKYGVNPSYEIVRELPARISSATEGGQDILIHKPSSPVNVAYRHVFGLVPELYKTYPNVRFFVHVGVSHLATCCSLERRARKGPYGGVDVDGRKWCDDTDEWDEVWNSAPDEIKSAVDVEGIAAGMTAEGKWEVATSDDAGLYLCEFIYFNSLHTAQRLNGAGRDIKGVFVHVPTDLKPEALDKERDTMLQIIKEMVRQADGMVGR